MIEEDIFFLVLCTKFTAYSFIKLFYNFFLLDFTVIIRIIYIKENKKGAIYAEKNVSAEQSQKT